MIGLEINQDKCSVLIRDPCGLVPTPGDHILIDGIKFKVVSVMKYLGVYLSADLARRSTVVASIKAAYKSFYMLVPFLTSNRLKWLTLVRIYHSVIVTIALYGLKVATLIGSNRISLRRMEANIVSKLCALARDPPTSTNLHVLLRGRTSTVRRLKYWGHVMRRPVTHLLRKAMGYRLSGKRKVGRPCFTWNDTLQRDITRPGLTDWEATVHDRVAHEAKCQQLYDQEEHSE